MLINPNPTNFNNSFTSHKPKKTTTPKPYNPNISINKPKGTTLKKLGKYILASLIGITSISTCNETKTAVVENVDDITVSYFNVKPEVKDSVLAPVLRLKSKLSKEDNFLDGLQLDITKKFKQLDNNNSFREYVKSEPESDYVKGISFYSDDKLPRRIIIQKDAHLDDKITNWKTNGKYSDIPALKQTVMHEVGHQFDNYYGHNHNTDFAVKWDSILNAKEMNPDTNPYNFSPDNIADKRLGLKYAWNSGLSDKKEFINALLEDVNNIKNINKKDLPNNINYYIGKLNIKKTLTQKDIEYAEQTRSEVYANLFSYALGENEGEKEKFIKCFEKSYNIVKKDIGTFLKVKL
jgi:hypothetical protein